jgi:NDP-sugar pyrophosphorylase family protein
VDRITMAVGHLAELLMAYFGDGSRWDVAIDYSREPEALGTVGPLTLIEDLPDHFLVMNGDVLTTLDYAELYAAHAGSDAELTIATHEMAVNIDLGVIEFDGTRRVTGYTEKPTLHYDVSMGVYVFSRSALDLAARGEFLDFPDVVEGLVDAGRAVRVFPAEGEWLDIGRHEDYATAVATFDALRHLFLPDEHGGGPSGS